MLYTVPKIHHHYSSTTAAVTRVYLTSASNLDPCDRSFTETKKLRTPRLTEKAVPVRNCCLQAHTKEEQN